MHANMSELLAAREGELGLASAHIAHCAVCKAELAKLEGIAEQLRQLPNDVQSQTGWDDIVKAHKQYTSEYKNRESAPLIRSIYALAASIMIVGFSAILSFTPLNESSKDDLISGLQAESRALEYTLAHYQPSEQHLTAAQQFKLEQMQWQLMMLDRRLVETQLQQNLVQQKSLWQSRVEHLYDMHAVYSSEPVFRQNHERRDVL
ncbi:hypothetical protein tinsulaeT_25410 [Thalassotalea insulae]|uniref:Zinc-finger domain-containing protein n=2 Tax=Thalassotalea insulae TaxID=2056778 RepID=A0ABQ6GX29_9GAMM|nr:hypothetical protein tinsulaeT_25410 [Thalassotalea insulae]